MVNDVLQARARPTRHRIVDILPAPRRFTVVLGLLASAGVAATSLRAWPAALLVPVVGFWLSAFIAGGLWPAGGRQLLIALAGCVKTITALLVIWAITHPHSPIGPHSIVDWVPLGALNAATGLWVLRVIRHRDGPGRPGTIPG